MRREDGAKPTSDRVRCIHMLEAARQAIVFVGGRVREDLDTDHMLRRAVKDCIQEIGEAATRVSDAGRAKAPGLPWKQIVGMRHRIVHVYYDIDADALWEVAVRDLPLLVSELDAVLAAWIDEA